MAFEKQKILQRFSRKPEAVTTFTDSGTTVYRNSARPSYRQALTWLFVIGVPASSLLFFLNIHLLQFGALSEITTNMQARVMLAYDGAPPRLENIGGIYPSVPFFLSLLLRDQLLATSLVGGFAFAGILWFIKMLRQSGCINSVLEFASMVYLLFLPQTLYILSQRMDICLVLLLFSSVLLWLRKTQRYSRVYHMAIAGLALALLFLSDSYATPVFLLFIPLMIIMRKGTAGSISAMTIMLYLPLLFFSLMQYPLSALFSDASDPFLEWNRRLLVAYDLEKATMWYAGNLIESLKFLFSRLTAQMFFLLPWLALGMLMLIRSAFGRPSMYSLYYFAPLIYCAGSIFGGHSYFVTDNASYLIFPAVALLLLHYDFGRPVAKNWPVTLLLVTTLAFSLVGGYRQAASTQDPMERKFYAAIVNGETDPEWTEKRALSRHLGGEEETGKILMDSRRNLDLIFISGNPKRFLLPYQLDFEVGLSLPAAYVEYVVVYDDPAQDMVAQRYPQAVNGTLPGFRLVEKFGPRLLYQRSATAAPLIRQ